MSDEKVKLCKNCKHFLKEGNSIRCMYYYESRISVDLVSGKRYRIVDADSNAPSKMRDGTAFFRPWKNCNQEGKFWEQGKAKEYVEK